MLKNLLLRVLLRAIQKTAEATSDLIRNEVTDKITKVSKTSRQNSLETVESETRSIEFDREMPRERYISPEKRQKINDDVRLIE